MLTSHRWLLQVAAGGALLFTLPIAATFFGSRGVAGCYETGVRCGCGHQLFIYIEGSGYYDLVPGHKQKRLRYSLQSVGPGEWVARKNGTNAFRLRLENGEVYRTFAGETNWFREERVVNLWRVWIPQLMPE
jgi:hypothetical protein